MTASNPFKSMDPELAAIIQRANEARPDVDREQELVDMSATIEGMGKSAGCPPEELEIIAYRRQHRTMALHHTQRLVSLGWGSSGRPPPGRKHWLYLFGPAGAGKTTATVWALLDGTCDAERRPRPGARRYVTSRSVADLNIGFGGDRGRLQELIECTWLILDDVGCLDGKDGFLAPAVQRLLYDRHEKRRRTILTSNMTVAHMSDYMERRDKDAAGHVVPGRLADRFAQLVTPVPTTEASLRRGDKR